MAPRHITDDDLELYALGRLADERAAPAEKHLPVCEECRARLAGRDEYVGAMQGGARGLKGIPHLGSGAAWATRQ